MRLSVIVLLTVCFITSCGGQRCTVTIINNTNVLLDSVRVDNYSFDHLFRNVEPQKSASTDFKVESAGNYRGAFRLRVYVKGSEKIATTFGYFDGSGDIKANYTIEVKNDFTIRESK